MTQWTVDYMPRDGQLFRLTLGEILASLVQKRFGRLTNKEFGRRYDMDPATAKNFRRGHASNLSITAFLRGEGDDVFEVLDAIGHALTGKTRHEWEEEKLQRIIDEANRAQEHISRLRARRALLAESPPALEEDPSWAPPRQHRREAR